MAGMSIKEEDDLFSDDGSDEEEKVKVKVEPSSSDPSATRTTSSPPLPDAQTSGIDPMHVSSMHVGSMHVGSMHVGSMHVGSSSSTKDLPPSSLLRLPTADPDPSVVHTDQVEWAGGPESPPEAAPRPKLRRPDPCGCVPSGNDGEACCTDMSCILHACQEECASDTCSAVCGNQRLTRKQWKPLRVIDAGVKGRGLVSEEPASRGDLIAEYVGVAVPKKALEKLFTRYRKERMLYIMALDRDIYIDARHRGGLARYINHSCDPNCVVHRWKVRGVSRCGVFALKEIKAGEELSFDYKWEHKRGRAPTKCHCKSDNCRGTLEMPVVQSQEEEELERLLKGHWKVHTGPNPGAQLVNRCIKIYFPEHHEYYVADVCKYDPDTRKHQVLFKIDHEESWEDLSKEQWMLLNEEGERFVIARKSKTLTPVVIGSSPDYILSSSLVGGIQNQTNENTAWMQQQQQQQREPFKNYIIVQTPMKDILVNRKMIMRAQSNCRVQINILQIVQSNQDTEEAREEHEALQQSKDGSVWKLTITGLDPCAACNFLSTNVQRIQQSLENQGNIMTDRPGSSRAGSSRSGSVVSERSSVLSANIYLESQEMVIPRCIVDQAKKRLFFIRSRCPKVSINFAPSDSKSKAFSKILIEGTHANDQDKALGVVWTEIDSLCQAAEAPKTPNGFYKNLGIRTGELSSERFSLLFGGSAVSTIAAASANGECGENLRTCPFALAFEETQRCSLWVQSEADMGRISADAQVINQAVPNAPRKLFVGCEPERIPAIWQLIQVRVMDQERGVKYMYLGSDRVFLPNLLQREQGHERGQLLFDLVRQFSGANVSADSMTSNFLRIDGGSVSSIGDSIDDTKERIALAEELIRLQIELYRDHFTRQQRWLFGRDWALCTEESSSLMLDPINRGSPKSAITQSLLSSPTQNFVGDALAISGACTEIAEIVEMLKLEEPVSAHATMIMYRYLRVLQNKSTETQLKLREILLACLYIANKAQKESKWKQTDEVVKAAFRVFYPSSAADKQDEAMRVLEDRIIVAEAEILITLNYDVFWPGVEWIMIAATEEGQIAKPLAQNVLQVTLSGPVLAVGPTLWLSFGPQYVFAAMAGFMSVNIEHLFAPLALIPHKVAMAAEIIANSIQLRAGGSKLRSRFHSLFTGGKQSLLNLIAPIKQVCAKSMTEGAGSVGASGLSKKFQIIGRRDCRQRAIRGVNSTILEERILPQIDAISAKSKCSIFVEASSLQGTEDIILEGNWRATSIAEYLLKEAASKTVEGSNERGEYPLPASTDSVSTHHGVTKLQAKTKPGFLDMKDVLTTGGWRDTLHSDVSSSSIGGKTCIGGRVRESSLQLSGLRWWISPKYAPSLTGSLCDICSLRLSASKDRSAYLDDLSRFVRAFLGVTSDNSEAKSEFPLLLRGSGETENTEIPLEDRFLAVSLQRWPWEKIELRERSKCSSDKNIGFSAAALQEMQLLTQLHYLIPAPQGHPNIVLPVAIGMPEPDDKVEQSSARRTASTDHDDIFGLFRAGATSEENERAARKEKRKLSLLTAPQLMFQPTPYLLHRVLSRRRRPVAAPLIASWFHDLLSAVSHCHSNYVVLRSLQPDQILLDQSGVLKLSGLYRSVVLQASDRGKFLDPVKSAHSKKKASSANEELNSPYAAPELILGATRLTKETNIWSVGCIMAHLILGKYLILGNDRSSTATSIFKIVGTPSKENYPEAVKFPKYTKPEKKYAPGVAKAVRFMWKDGKIEELSGAVDLIEQMLRLDPRERITADEALEHPFMTDYIEKTNQECFRNQFVKEWMALQKELQTEKTSNTKKAASQKRKALLLAASSTTDGDDDLYGDLTGDASEKRLRPGASELA